MQPNLRVTAIRVDHPGFTVPNLDEAISFFSAFGFRVLFQSGWNAGAPWMTGHLDVSPSAIERLAQITLGHGDTVELMEFQLSERNLEAPKNSDAGGRHLALQVESIEETERAVKQMEGVRLVGSPVEVTSGPAKGVKSLYLVTPWGMYLELIERSHDIEQDR